MKFLKMLCMIAISTVLLVGCEHQWHSNFFKKDTGSTYEEVSSTPCYEEQSSNPTSAVESNLENLTSSQNATVDKSNLSDFGEFSSIHKLRNHLERNLENPLYVLATVEGLVVRTNNNQDIYILDEPENSGVAWRYAKKNKIVSEMLELADDFIKITMKDDTKNRVITGDYIKLSGVLNTSDFQFFDSEYEMIEAVE